MNKDNFFNAPTETVECRSEETAKTSPYDYVTTVVYPDCVATGDCGAQCKNTQNACLETEDCDTSTDSSNICDTSKAWWGSNCGGSFCYGVPLYRQLLTQKEKEEGTTKGQQIRMMGMNFFQRSNLTVNHGTYYIDTTVSKETQEQGLQNAGLPHNYNVFMGEGDYGIDKSGQGTYYVLLIFAKATTQQPYQINVGDGFDSTTDVKAIRSLLKKSRPLDIEEINWPANWTREYNNGYLEVTVDMSVFENDFNNAKMDRCQLLSFCEWKDSENGCGCSEELKNTNPDLFKQCEQKLGDNENTICSWSVRAVDCPEGGCLGFSFKLPKGFEQNNLQPPPPSCYPNNQNWNVDFDKADKPVAGDCHYEHLPSPEFCTASQ